MGSPVSGTSSGSMSSLQDCGENLHTTEMRKRKRMLSNRESARRSRMRKQKMMDDLTAQINNLRAENNHILTNTNLVTHLYLKMESENSVLRVQMSELNHRLQSLNEISMVSFLSSQEAGASATGFQDFSGDYDDLFNPWTSIHVNHPIMASPHAFLY